VQRERVRDVLVGADDDDAARLAVHTAQVEDVASLGVSAEHLLVVDQPEPALPARYSRTVLPQLVAALAVTTADIERELAAAEQA
jgi:hypothetical protein